MSECSKLALAREGIVLGVKIRLLGEIHPVVGYWGDTFTDLDHIIRVIPGSRVLYLLRVVDWPISNNWVDRCCWSSTWSGARLASPVPQHSLCLGQAACLAYRIGHLGVGARETVARGTVAVVQEVKLQEDVHFLTYVRGRGGWSGR